MTDNAQSKTAASSLPLWPGEKPTAGDARKWLEDAEPLLSQAQRALLYDITPASFVKYNPVTVPQPLLVSAAEGVTSAMVAAHSRAIQTATDTNAEREATKQAAYAELRSELFAVLERALLPNAPLLVKKLKKDCAQAAPYAAYFDGKAAWDVLKNMGKTSASLPGEGEVHEAYFTKLVLSPLPNDATPAQFSERVTTAITYHAPYLKRPFPSQTAIAEWVVSQTPEKHRDRAQDKFDALTATEQSDPHGVASMIVTLLAQSRSAHEVLKDSALKEFVGVADDAPPTGRRPPGMGGKGGGGGGGGGGSGKGKGGGKGKGSGGKGKGGGKGGSGDGAEGGVERATTCSTPPPRGPTCDRAHHGPCWRDPQVSQIPKRVFDDERALAKLKADRIVQAQRLGESCVELTPVDAAAEVVAVLDEDSTVDPQWPVEEDDDDVVDPLPVDPKLTAAERQELQEASAHFRAARIEAERSAAAHPPNVLTADVGGREVTVSGGDPAARLSLLAALRTDPSLSGVSAPSPAPAPDVASDVTAERVEPTMTDAQRARAEGNRANALRIQNARLSSQHGELTTRLEQLQWQLRSQKYTMSAEPVPVSDTVVSDSVVGSVGAAPAPATLPIEVGLARGLLADLGSSAAPDASQREQAALDSASEALHQQLSRAIATLLVAGVGGDVPDLRNLKPASVRRARATLRSHSVRCDDWSPAKVKAGAWLAEYVAPPRDHTVVRYVADNPMRRHALGLIRHRLLVHAGARDAVNSQGNYEKFIVDLDSVADVYVRAVNEGRLMYEENGADDEDADHSGVLLEPVVPEGLAVLVPLRPSPDSTAGVALAVSERLHAFAAPLARFLAVLLVLLAVLLFHRRLEAAWPLVLHLCSHLYVHGVLGHGGADYNDDYDYNTSLYDMAVAPPNVLVEARRGNPFAVGLVTSFVLFLGLHRDRCVRGVLKLWRAITRLSTECTVFFVLLFFVWVCVWRASAHDADADDDGALAQRRILPEITHRAALHPYTAALLQQCTSGFHAVLERWNGIVHVDFESADELVAILGVSSSAMAAVWDTGSRRHVVMDKRCFVPGTEKPCPFRIRGVNTGGRQPDCMGDVEHVFPLCGGGTITHRCRDAVCIPDAPHNIIGAGLLEAEGLCDWRGALPDGRQVYLENHRFLLMPFCKAGQAAHDYERTSDGVMLVEAGGPPVEPQAKEVTSAPPNATNVAPPALPSKLLYWFSGTNQTETGMAAQWHTVSGGECVYRDTQLDASHTLLNDEVYQEDLRGIRDGSITRGLFSIPCGTFSVSRYRHHPRVRVLREAGQDILGMSDLSATDRAAVNVANILVERTCSAIRALAAGNGLWIVENPVRRNDSSGPWKRFNSGKFPKHGSLWQMPAIVDLARDLGARVAHLPLCWFEHDASTVAMVEQKYISLMYSPALEPALGFLRRTRCVHLAHAKVAVGFGSDGKSLGAASGKYPAELNRILARALAYPDHCASDGAWGTALDFSLAATYDAGAPVDFDAERDQLDHAQSAAVGGIAGDRRADGAGAKLARGHTVNRRQLTSRQVHEMFAHKPAEVLRLLPSVCGDVPPEWAQLLDLSVSCPDCIAGKHTHFGSHSGLPEVSSPGEIVAFDLLILRSPDIFTGGTIIFGAIDLYSDWDVIIKIKYKSDVPECLKEVLRIFKSYGHEVQRLHTDGEAVFHSDETFESIKAELQGVGCLVTTGADYDHRQNSKIERHFRRLGDDARPGFLQSALDDRFYQCALVDASAKHKLLPLARVEGHSPTTLMTGKLGAAMAHRAFGSLGYVMLEHELNDSTVKLNKSHARAEPGILLSYGVTGVLRDRRVPAWVLYVPALHRAVPFVTPHCTVVLGCYPGVDGLRGGLSEVLRTRSGDTLEHAIHMDVGDDGVVVTGGELLAPKSTPSAPPLLDDDTAVEHTHHAPPAAPATPTIAQRLSRRTAHPHAGTNRVAGALDFDALADDSSLLLEEHHDARPVLQCVSLHPSAGGSCDPAPFMLTLDEAPWLSSPGGGGCRSDEEILVADLDAEAARLDDMVFLCNDTTGEDIKALPGVHRHVTKEAPRAVVRFPWGDVPSPWVEGYSTIYDTGIDDSVFVLDEYVLTSLIEDDDPTWDQAIASNERQQWYAAADSELDNLERFEVFTLIPADQVPCDEDIFDLMLLCKKKRGQDNICLKYKVRCVLCGNQVVNSAKRGLSKTTVDLRTHSPAVRASSLKMNFAVGVLDDLRMLDFDVDAAYLQGRYVDRRIFARAPKYYRKFDERGVELVWHLQRALYGGPDSGRVWYNTFAHYLMVEERETPFARCHFEPCTFTHFLDGQVDSHGRPQRIVLSVYVDDGRTWDNCPAVCDAFYARLKQRFSITMDGAAHFMIGMDISLGEGWLKICSSTYIRNLCHKWLEYPIEEYDYVGTPTYPKLYELYEAAVLTRGNTPAELATRYRSLVGALIFPAPTTRPDCLYAVGLLARAMDCATIDLFNAALYCLVFMGQTHAEGITYLRDAPGGRRYEQWSDSDWGTRRSTTGGTGQLAGGSVQAASRKQDCTSTSSTHAEIIAASANSNDVVWARGYLEEIGLPQGDDPTPFYVDAANVITLVHNLISSKATRHITRRECVVREREADGTIVVTKVGTNDNLADLFTKALPRDPFTKLRKLVMNILAHGVIAPVPRARRIAASRGA